MFEHERAYKLRGVLKSHGRGYADVTEDKKWAGYLFRVLTSAPSL